MIKPLLQLLTLSFLLFVSACSTSTPAKLDFQKVEIGVIPVIINNGKVPIDQALVKHIGLAFLLTKLELAKDVNIDLKIGEPMVLDDEMELSCPFNLPLDGIQFQSPYKHNIVMFINIPNECNNLLGCSYLDSINLAPAVPTIITLSEDEVMTAITMIHEIGHIIGARHLNDTHVMTAAAQWTMYMDFSRQSLEEIYKVLSILYVN